MARLSEMGQMASALAHELNQPLTAIANYLHACRRIIDASGDRVPPKIAEIMEKTVLQAARAGQIIRRLREFIQKGETERAQENLNKVVEEATALALVGSKELGVRPMFDFASDIETVLIDEDSDPTGRPQPGSQRSGGADGVRAAQSGREDCARRWRGGRQHSRHRAGACGYGATKSIPTFHHHEAERHGVRSFNLPLDRRSAWRPTLGHAQPRSRRDVLVHASCRIVEEARWQMTRPSSSSMMTTPCAIR